MNKSQANYYLRRIYSVLRDPDRVEKIKMRFLDKYSGLLPGDGTIVVDPTEAILPAILHECLHELYDDVWSESMVVHAEAQMCKLLGPRQWRNLYHVAGSIL